jgi:hypothetical protein
VALPTPAASEISRIDAPRSTTSTLTAASKIARLERAVRGLTDPPASESGLGPTAYLPTCELSNEIILSHYRQKRAHRKHRRVSIVKGHAPMEGAVRGTAGKATRFRLVSLAEPRAG